MIKWFLTLLTTFTSLFTPVIPTPSTTPLPVLFSEMTVPALRSRAYSSSISSISQLSENSAYISYLASYNSDGLKINGLLTKPKGEMPQGGWPAIVFVHGYIPPTLYKTTQNYAAYIDYLAKKGFVVFKIDLRGHADSEGEAGGGYFSADYIVDTLNARAALQSADFVKPEHVGLWGHSMAGNVVLRSMVAQPDIPAVVIWAGAVYSYSDQTKYGINDNSYRPPVNPTQRASRRQQLFNTHGQFSSESAFWKQVAPTNYLSDIKGAIQIHHAVDDNVVNIGYSRDLNALLGKTKVEHQLYEYLSGGHNISGTSFNIAMQRTADFYFKHLR